MRNKAIDGSEAPLMEPGHKITASPAILDRAGKEITVQSAIMYMPGDTPILVIPDRTDINYYTLTWTLLGRSLSGHDYKLVGRWGVPHKRTYKLEAAASEVLEVL
jgi:hypothetical protein